MDKLYVLKYLLLIVLIQSCIFDFNSTQEIKPNIEFGFDLNNYNVSRDTIRSGDSFGEILIKNGAEQVYVSATHGIFPNDSLKKLLDSSDIKEVVVTNTLPIEHNHDKLTILSISELIGEAIKRINRGDSVGALFM